MIKKAVIPAAGFGTAFLPATKAMPREMLPIVDTPTIQFIVEEAVQSGVHDIMIITGRGKGAIENFFDANPELEHDLTKRGKTAVLKELRRLAELARVHYIRQAELNGLGHAVGLAREHVGDAPFVVMLGDSIVHSDSLPCTRRLIDTYNRFGGHVGVVAVEARSDDELSQFGVVDVEPVNGEDGLFKVTGMVEKPLAGRAPSHWTLMGRYVLTPDIFDAIDRTPASKRGYIELTDAMDRLIRDGVPFYAVASDAVRFDIGSKIGYARAYIELALQRSDIGPELKDWLRGMFQSGDGA